MKRLSSLKCFEFMTCIYDVSELASILLGSSWATLYLRGYLVIYIYFLTILAYMATRLTDVYLCICFHVCEHKFEY